MFLVGRAASPAQSSPLPPPPSPSPRQTAPNDNVDATDPPWLGNAQGLTPRQHLGARAFRAAVKPDQWPVEGNVGNYCYAQRVRGVPARATTHNQVLPKLAPRYFEIVPRGFAVVPKASGRLFCLAFRIRNQHAMRMNRLRKAGQAQVSDFETVVHCLCLHL